MVVCAQCIVLPALLVVGLVLFVIASVQSIAGNGPFLPALSESWTIGDDSRLPMVTVCMHAPCETLRYGACLGKSSMDRLEFGRGK